MTSKETEDQYYDHTDFNTRAGINDQASHSSMSSEHSNKVAVSSNKYITPDETIPVTDKIMSNDDNSTSFENRAYQFDEVPLHSPVKNEVSFDDDVQRINSITSEDMKKKVVNVEQEKRSIIKNVIIICVAFMLLFAAFQSMSALQSSINKVIPIL